MEFSIKLAGWVLDDPVFHQEKKNMVSKHFILLEMHFKADLFLSNYDYDFKIRLRSFKAFLDQVFFH